MPVRVPPKLQRRCKGLDGVVKIPFETASLTLGPVRDLMRQPECRYFSRNPYFGPAGREVYPDSWSVAKTRQGDLMGQLKECLCERERATHSDCILKLYLI
jgi:hypothetical protein